MPGHHALVTGTRGIIGLNLVQELAEHGDWTTTAVSGPLSMDLALFMPDKRLLWCKLKKAHGLLLDLDEIQNWSQGYILNSSLEMHGSTIRIRQAGFHDCLDSQERLFELLDEMRERKYIP